MVAAVLLQLFAGFSDEDEDLIKTACELLRGDLYNAFFSVPINLPGTTFYRGLKVRQNIPTPLPGLSSGSSISNIPCCRPQNLELTVLSPTPQQRAFPGHMYCLLRRLKGLDINMSPSIVLT